MSIGELFALLEKLRAAQKAAECPASYPTSHEASTAAIYENLADEAIAQWNRQQEGTP